MKDIIKEVLRKTRDGAAAIGIGEKVTPEVLQQAMKARRAILADSEDAAKEIDLFHIAVYRQKGARVTPTQQQGIKKGIRDRVVEAYRRQSHILGSGQKMQSLQIPDLDDIEIPFSTLKEAMWDNMRPEERNESNAIIRLAKIRADEELGEEVKRALNSEIAAAVSAIETEKDGDIRKKLQASHGLDAAILKSMWIPVAKTQGQSGNREVDTDDLSGILNGFHGEKHALYLEYRKRRDAALSDIAAQR